MSTAPLLQAILGPEDRAELLRDLSALATEVRAQIDDGVGTQVCRLDEAFAALEEGRARRALIRYRHEGRRWFDTLLPDGGRADLIRLVRVAEADIVATEESDGAEAEA